MSRVKESKDSLWSGQLISKEAQPIADLLLRRLIRRELLWKPTPFQNLYKLLFNIVLKALKKQALAPRYEQCAKRDVYKIDAALISVTPLPLAYFPPYIIKNLRGCPKIVCINRKIRIVKKTTPLDFKAELNGFIRNEPNYM